MPTAVTRAMLQVIYLVKHPSPRTPNALRELLGLTDVRAQDATSAAQRSTLDVRGAAFFGDDPSLRATAMNLGGDVVAPYTVSGTNHNFRASALFDDASIVAFTCSADATVSSFDVFSCTRLEKLILNVGGSNDLTLTHNGSGSGIVEDNAIRCVGREDIVLPPGGAAWLTRDPMEARWRLKPTDFTEATVDLEIDLDFTDPNKSHHQVTVGSL